MINQIAIDNIKRSKMKGKEKNLKINYYYIPSELTNNVLLFEPEKLKLWWEQGYDYASSNDPVVLDNKKKNFFSFFS